MSLHTWSQPSKAIVHKSGQEERAGRVEMSVRGDLWQNNSSKSERGGVQDVSETCYDVSFGDAGHGRSIKSRKSRVMSGLVVWCAAGSLGVNKWLKITICGPAMPYSHHNEFITTVLPEQFGNKGARLRWFGHVQSCTGDIFNKGRSRWSCQVGEMLINRQLLQYFWLISPAPTQLSPSPGSTQKCFQPLSMHRYITLTSLVNVIYLCGPSLVRPHHLISATCRVTTKGPCHLKYQSHLNGLIWNSLRWVLYLRRQESVSVYGLNCYPVFDSLVVIEEAADGRLLSNAVHPRISCVSISTLPATTNHDH